MVKKYIDDDTLTKFFESKKIKEKYKIALLISVKDGLRASEISNLQIKHLEFDRNLYRLKTQKNGLKCKARYMCNTCKLALKNYINKFQKEIKKHDNYIVYSNMGTRLVPGRISYQFYIYMKRLKLRKIYGHTKSGKPLASNSFHGARARSTHKFALKLQKKLGYIPIESLRQHGGWKSYSMPKHYADLLDDEFIQLNGVFRESL